LNQAADNTKQILFAWTKEFSSMTRQQKYYFDLHIHTSRYSPCASLPPEKLIAAARARGLDGIALTDHAHLWSAEELADLKREAGCPDYPVLSGCEFSTSSEGGLTGDLLVFGATALPSEPCSINQLCLEVHRQRGIVIAPHPYAEVNGIGQEAHSALIDAIEIANFRYRDPNDQQMERDFQPLGLPWIASSDAHELSEIGRYCTEFSEPIASEQDLMKAILANRCTPRKKPPPAKWRRMLASSKS
jgi:predicted metal-dependent phosphoesterase TrpH